jgi:Tol biopolymer transport system component
VVTAVEPETTDDSLMIVAAAGAGEPTRFASGADPSWSPGGERLVFSRRTGASGAGTELFVASLDGSQTTSLGQGSEPAWSPGGETVAYVRSAANERVLRTRADGSPWLVVQEWSRDVWAVNVLSRAQFRLTTSTPAPEFDLDAWLRAADAAGPPETGQVIAVVESDHSDLHPAWGEDGRTLLFVRCGQPSWSSAGAFSVCRLTLRLR